MVLVCATASSYYTAFALATIAGTAAVVAVAVNGGWQGFIDTLTNPQTAAAIELTVITSLAVAILNVLIGTLIAWVLVRDDFPGKSFVNALIDLPFALPTIVASLVLLALYGNHSPVGLHLQHTGWGVGAALAFVTNGTTQVNFDLKNSYSDVANGTIGFDYSLDVPSLDVALLSAIETTAEKSWLRRQSVRTVSPALNVSRA